MDSYFLKEALKDAALWRGFTAPNPAVGAVLVEKNRILARGAHIGAGHPHAEAVALANIASVSPQTVLYVTLEPCNHFGRTPPCTDLIREKGICKVIYGYRDPNPKVTGGGHAALQASGIFVHKASVPEIDAFYESYHHWLVTGRPWISVKIALSLDGKVAGKGGERLKISGAQFDALVHARRLRCDGILTTASTVINDNPQLNARIGRQTTSKKVYVIDSSMRMIRYPHLQLFTTALKLTILHKGTASVDRRYRCFSFSDEEWTLDTMMKRIGSDGVHDLWVEAGPSLTDALFKENLVDEAFIAIGACSIGEGLKGPNFPDLKAFSVSWKIMGEDAICHLKRHVYWNR